MNDRINISCGIVLYNPNIERLKENLEKIYPQVSELFVFDNGSYNSQEIEDVLKEYACGKIYLIKSNSNLGIATALNNICHYSEQKGEEWVLTLDQDSVPNDDLVSKYRRYINDNSTNQIGMITCNIQDRNIGEIDKTSANGENLYISKCITSGSLIQLKAWKKCEGFDDFLFIDRVDTDICYCLQEHGYKIVRVNYDGLLHEIGKSKIISVFGKKYRIYNHPFFRRYYITRNSIIVSKRYHKTSVIHEVIYATITNILILIYENDKWNKLKAGIKGIKDGMLHSYERGKMDENWVSCRHL